MEKDTGIVRFPDRLVEDAISLAPSQIALSGRNPDYDILVGNTKTAFVNFSLGRKANGMSKKSSKGMDLKLGTSPLGSPETVMLAVSVAELCRYYQIPSMVPGIASDSKQPDLQAAYEKALTGVPAAMAGANMVK